jgi:hypothetical protein
LGPQPITTADTAAGAVGAGVVRAVGTGVVTGWVRTIGGTSEVGDTEVGDTVVGLDWIDQVVVSGLDTGARPESTLVDLGVVGVPQAVTDTQVAATSIS